MFESMPGVALSDLGGPLSDFLGKLLGRDGSLYLRAFKRMLRKQESWGFDIQDWPTFGTISLDSSLKNADDFVRVLKEQGNKISNWARDLISKPEFVESLKGADSGQQYELVILTTTQLTGKEGGGTTAEVFAGAERLGLQKCPAWIGPQLRKDYQDQPQGEVLFMGMEPITVSGGVLRVFDVGYHDSELWLSAHCAAPGCLWAGGYRWVFARRK